MIDDNVAQELSVITFYDIMMCRYWALNCCMLIAIKPKKLALAGKLSGGIVMKLTSRSVIIKRV